MKNNEQMQRAVNDASSQFLRHLSGPKPELGAVDSRSLAQLLSFASDYGELLNFYDLEDKVDGDWRVFFAADPTLIAAGIVAVDLDTLERRFSEIYRRASGTSPITDRVEALTDLIDFVVSLSRRFDTWYLGATKSDGAARLCARLQRVIDGELGQRIRNLRGLVLGAQHVGMYWPREVDFDALSTRWRIHSAWSGEAVRPGQDRAAYVDDTLFLLRATFNTLLDELGVLRREVEPELESRVVGGQHRPQLALWIGFVDLFRRIQAENNGIAERFVEFYYREVLRMGKAAAQPDRAYLVLTLAAADQPEVVWVESGTEFSAEGMDGESLIYSSVDGRSVSSAALVCIRTLRVGRTLLGAATEPEAGRGASHMLPTTVSESIVDLAALALTNRGFSTFGREFRPDESTPAINSVELTRLAELGLLIASPELALAGGTRRVTCAFDYGDFAATLHERIDAIRIAGSDDSILSAVLESAFRLQVSTADGWLRVPRYTAVCNIASRVWTLEFILTPSFPALTPFSDAIETAPDAREARMPSLLMALVQEKVEPVGPGPTFAPVYPLSLLAGMPAISISLAVSVDGLLPAVIENTDGQIDPSSPFSVFGAVPVVGSYLRLRCPELFSKQIAKLTLTVDWYDLPSGSEGFYGYYSGYTLCPRAVGQGSCFDNSLFKVTLGLGAPGLWTIPEVDPYELFRSKNGPTCDGTVRPDPKGPLCNLSVFVPAVAQNPSPPAYYVPFDNYLEIRLATPEYAFGDSIYAENVLAAVVTYLPYGTDCALECETRYADLREAALSARHCLGNTADEPRQCLESVHKMLDSALGRCKEGGCEQCASCSYFEQAIAAVDACLGSLVQERRGEVCKDLPVRLEEIYNQAITDCVKGCSGEPKPLDYPNVPYQPRAESVTLHYESGGRLSGELQHLLPFGGRQTLPLPDGSSQPSLLPQFDFAGALYLGLSSLMSDSPLTLLQRVAAATNEQRPSVCWSSLGLGPGGKVSWNQFEIGDDGTLDMSNTGILDIRNVGSRLCDGLGFEDDLHWLQASVAATPERFPDTIAIIPNALVVCDRGGASDPENNFHQLAAHSITASVEPLSRVASIDQPLPSFGGHPADDRQSWWLRATERLHHKSRSIQDWDQERLVLDLHPWVWKVRVLQAHDLGQGRRPGWVLVVVIPKGEAAAEDNPREPRASPEQLRAVHDTLTCRSSVFAQIEVVSPNYRGLRVITRLAFVAGGNSVALREQLDQELQAYLSPGFFSVERELIGGSYVQDDAIEAFVQSRPYVRYIESLATERMDNGFDPALDWCFLTSAPKHTIIDVGGARRKEDEWLVRRT